MNEADTTTYERLAQALDRLPNGFPPTASGVEVELLASLVPGDLAEVAGLLGREPLPVADVAASAHLPQHETARRLDELVELGAASADPAGDYLLEPFWPGLFDARAADLSTASALLFERYMTEGGAGGIMGAEPPMGRVLPGLTAARSDWIMPYDDVRRVIERSPAVSVVDCVCRLERIAAGGSCRFPVHVCLILGDSESQEADSAVTRDQALALLAESEELGLVHVATNVGGGWEFVCNCCGCCCQFLRSLNEWDVANAVVRNYEAVVSPDACTACGLCEERCQVGAIAVADEVAVVDDERCIGCGLCVTGCPDDAVALRRLPEARVTAPPAGLRAWGDERLRRR